MARNDFIFVDESGDTGYKLAPDTGELLSSPYYVLAALHVTDDSIRWINRHVAAFRFYTGFYREMKLPPEKEIFDKLVKPLNQLAVSGSDVFASVVYLDKIGYTGHYLKPHGRRPQSSLYFRNWVLRCLLESHFQNYELVSGRYELILDRVDMSLEDTENLRAYLRNNRNFATPSFITHASSIYVEGLQVVHHIASGFKNVVLGNEIPDSLTFVKERDITTNLGIM